MTRIPDVSVVIPLYNAEAWIEATVRSVAEQTCAFDRIEVIVVDNGSSDSSAAVARDALADSQLPFEIVQTGKNNGPSSARNIGWRRANAALIQFLDSDDLLNAEKLKLQMAAASAAPAQVATLYSEWQPIVFDGSWSPCSPLFDPDLEDDVIANLLTTENFIHTGSALYRKSWLDRVGGFNESYWFIEDVDLNLRLAMAGGTFLKVSARAPLFFYRKRGPASLSGSNRAEFLKGCVRNLRTAEAFWISRGGLTDSRLGFLLDAYENLLRGLAEADRAAFDGLLEHVRLLDPTWIPRQNRKMRMMSRAIGYRRAEDIAIKYRNAKATFLKGPLLGG